MESAPRPAPTRILLVEDSQVEAVLIEGMLEEAAGPGAYLLRHVTTVADAVAALQQRGDTDVVLLDLTLPDSYGLQTVETVKPVAQGVPLVVLTGVDDQELAVQTTKAHAQDYLLKGEIKPHLLWRSVRLAIERQRLQHELTEATAQLTQANQKLAKLARFDPLTDLLNRRGFEAALAAEQNRVRRANSRMGMMLIDLDDFKSINDEYGYTAGDAVLLEVADRIKGSVRPSDHVGRIGGDEFVLLLPDTRIAEVVVIAERVRQVIRSTPVAISRGQLCVSASIGVAEVPICADTIEDLLAAGQTAVKRSKTCGKDRVARQQDDDDGSELAALIESLRSGDYSRVLARPIYRLDSETLAGCAVKLRGPFVSATAPEATAGQPERHDLPTEIEPQSLHLCLQRGTTTVSQGGVHVAVRPAALLTTPLETLTRLSELFEGSDRHVCLEIDEGHIVGDPSRLCDVANRLRAAGLRVGLGCLGLSSTSLETLIVLTPDFVTIPSSFVSNAVGDPAARRSLLRLARMIESLGATSIADGIDQRADLELLRDMGIMYGQGKVFECPSRLD